MVGLFRQSATAQAGQAEAKICRSCDAIAGAYRFYSAGWKKFERAWDTVIRIKQLSQIRPLLEAVLAPLATSVADLAPEGLPKKLMEV